MGGEGDGEGNAILDLSLTTTSSISSETISAAAVATTYRSNSCDDQLMVDEDYDKEQDEEEAQRNSLTQDDDDEGGEQDDDRTEKRQALVFPSSVSNLCRFFGVHTNEIFSGGTHHDSNTSLTHMKNHFSKLLVFDSIFVEKMRE